MTLERVLISHFEIPVGTVNFDKLHHASSQGRVEQRKYFEQVGKSIVKSVCALIATQQDIAESDLDRLVGNIRYYIQTECFGYIYQSVASYVEFGPGVTDREKNEEGAKSSICYYLLGYLAYRGRFDKCFNYFSRHIVGNEFDLTADYKTILQEYCQRKKIPIPIYEVESVYGPPHDQKFICTCEISGLGKFKGKDTSKKRAQQKAAESAASSLKEVRRNVVKISSVDYLYFNKGVKGNVTSKNAHKNFSIPNEFNILPAYIPPRQRLKNYWGERSHRSLAMLGAYVLEYFVSVEILLRALRDTLNLADRGVIGEGVLKTSNLRQVYDYGIISSSDLPFKGHDEFEQDYYKVDCVQALFAIKFLLSMSNGRPSELWDCEFSQWMKRVISSITEQFKGRKPDKISITSNRYQSAGFVYENVNSAGDDNTFAIKITHLKNGAEYTFTSSGPYNSKKEARLDLAGRTLSIIDAVSGLVLPRNFNKYNDKQLGLARFICEQLIISTKQDDELRQKIDREIDSNLYSSSTPELNVYEILTTLCENDLLMIDRARYISSLHQKLGLSGDLVSLKNTVYYPFVFESYISDDVGSELIEYINDTTLVKEEDLTSKADDSDGKRIKDIIVNKKNTDNKPIGKRINDSIYIENNINNYKKNVEKKSINELERLWRERVSSFEYREEASVVLSILRFQKGIDFVQKSYSDFIDSELIAKLGLPKISSLVTINKFQEITVNTALAASIDNASADKNQSKVKSKFQVRDDDEREFSKVNIARRKGQQEFRRNQVDRWGSCCISGCSIPEALEAAHIAPYRGEKDNHPLNGILLRADIHKLFDKYLIGIEPESFLVRISTELSGSEYSNYEGVKLGLGTDAEVSVQAIQYHWHYFAESQGV